MTRSAANPQELRDYLSLTNGRREDANTARDQLITAYEAFVAALPEGFTAPSRPDIAGPLGRSRDVDAYTGTVADRFEQVGSLGEGGVFTVDSALLASIPYTSQYSEQRREQLRQRAEEELANLREVITNGSPTETTVGELVGIVGWMRWEVDHAPTPEARQQVAEDLIDTMGAGDLHEALAILEGEAQAQGLDDLDESSQPILAVADLAYVVSLGLEGNPSRAGDWAQRLADLDRADEEARAEAAYDPDVTVRIMGPRLDDLALLGHYMADGTETFGVALFDQLWDAPPLAEDGVAARLFDATSPLHPMLINAADNPTLANGLVDHLIDTTDLGPTASESDDRNRFYTLFADTIDHADNPLFDDDEVVRSGQSQGIPRDLLGDVLTSSVHPTLDDGTRIHTAAAVTDHYLHTPDNLTYPDPVIRGLATTTQPLLESWEEVEGDPDGALELRGYSTEDADRVNDDLWRAIGDYGQNEGGVEGLASALSGATADQLIDAQEAGGRQPQLTGATHPFPPDDLQDINRMLSKTATTISGARFGEVVAALEESGVDWTTVHTAAVKDVLAGAGGPAGGLLDAGYEYLEAYEDQAPEVTDRTANPFYTLEPVLNTVLIDMTLESHPDLYDALHVELQETARRGGHRALIDLVQNPPADDPNLIRLRDLVNAQAAAIDLADAQDIFEVTNPAE